MKKILAFVAATLFGAAAFAGSWQSTVGLGFAIPISTFGIDEDGADDIKQTSFNADLMYLGVHTENGLTAKFDFSIGVPKCDDIPDGDGEDPIDFTFDLGVGYSFIRTEKITLGVLGVFGFDHSSYDSKATFDGYTLPIDSTIGLTSINFGVDAIGAFRFTNHFGGFANIGLRYVIAGTASTEYDVPEAAKNLGIGDDNDVDISGKISFRPTIGLIWTF